MEYVAVSSGCDPRLGHTKSFENGSDGSPSLVLRVVWLALPTESLMSWIIGPVVLVTHVECRDITEQILKY